MDTVRQLQESLYRGFIDQKSYDRSPYAPKLLINDKKKHEEVLTTLLHELYRCDSFFFSVAFITESGLATLKTHLLELKKRGVYGRILTSTFLQFNQPKVFQELLKITNVEVRLAEIEGFHSKGYVFKHKDHYSLMVGSSNLTVHALKVNYEWNIKLHSHENGEVIHHFGQQFEDTWSQAIPLTKEWIEKYQQLYRPQAHEKIAELSPGWIDRNAMKEALEIKPNKMQEAALKELDALRTAGQRKGLIISATGTGKTYLAAFDVRKYQPRKMLFIVHREQILRKAKDDFARILGGRTENFGLYTGSGQDTRARYVFATIQTIAKDIHLQRFAPEAFDYILIDEVHKAGAPSYQKVIDYFQPSFLLGMTATPERSDDVNIFALFDYQVAYEIRLQEALEEEMLCPFHYFGVTDYEKDGEVIDQTTDLSRLISEERVEHLLEKIHYYGHSGETVRGLIFCSRNREAEELSTLMNQKGRNTVVLTGADSQDERWRQVNRLENGVIEYIITVDIFNEGIDIPGVNQVVMLRQTQSRIIFTQQLGRGLRKDPSKDFVTVIDFIGNYKKNYLIPVALSGDRSLNKDHIRRRMQTNSFVQGVSSINFEEVAKKKVFAAIDQTNLQEMRKLKESYMNVKQRIGRRPLLKDFLQQNAVDPEMITSKYGNYYRFLCKLKEQAPQLSLLEDQLLYLISAEFINGKRRHEAGVLWHLLENDAIAAKEMARIIRASGEENIDAAAVSVKRMLTTDFFTDPYQKKYGRIPLIKEGSGGFTWTRAMQKALAGSSWFRTLVEDVLVCAELKNEQYEKPPFTLYQKYSRKDVCRLLNWENDESSTIYGYKTKYGTTPIFITYHKPEDVEANINYEDEFISRRELQWYTRSNRTTASKEVQEIIHADGEQSRIYIFVKKDDDEGREFYYLGEAEPLKHTVENTSMQDKNGKLIPVVRMRLHLKKKLMRLSTTICTAINEKPAEELFCWLH
ncbi:helicase [Marinococcus halophilus]|uniref:Helicase n=1 Tax=Marinococcus halophilus TaxID=1371 RepID=A0A510Y5T7_MARHA|nr:DEAD/DEAH box helicase [Marinococcus halophilus]GEK58712.1 helicase [Marinococcus halophilus]